MKKSANFGLLKRNIIITSFPCILFRLCTIILDSFIYCIYSSCNVIIPVIQYNLRFSMDCDPKTIGQGIAMQVKAIIFSRAFYTNWLASFTSVNNLFAITACIFTFTQRVNLSEEKVKKNGIVLVFSPDFAKHCIVAIELKV